MARTIRYALTVSICLALVVAATAQDKTTDALIKFHQSRAAADPTDFLAWNRLASAYVQKARESGDISYYDLAEQAAHRSLALVSEHPSAATATTYLALVAFARHRFAEAGELARKAVALEGRDGSAWMIIGDSAFEIGDYDAAQAAYAKISSIPGVRPPHSRLAALQFVHGEPRRAIQSLELAAKTAAQGAGSRENTAWHHAQLGDAHSAIGDLGAAEKAYDDALLAFPHYHRGLAGLARVRSGQQRYDEAVTFYDKAIGVIPLPEYAAEVGDVLTRLGRGAEAAKRYALVEHIGRLSALNATLYNRELALFYADRAVNLDVAVELARRELTVRRDIYTYDVLAWALLKSGRPREALEAMREALRLGTKDARLFFHAGMIHRQLGEAEPAKDYLARALAINPHFHVLHGAVARRTLQELTTPGEADHRAGRRTP